MIVLSPSADLALLLLLTLIPWRINLIGLVGSVSLAIMRLLLILPWLCLLALSGCRREEGALYREQLADAIRNADTIQITEHSNPFDFRDDKGNIPDHVPTRIYREITLPPDAVEVFYNEIKGMNPDLSVYGSSCLFVDHHTIRFIKNGATTSTMKICLGCAQIQWDGTTHSPPESLGRHLSLILFWNGFKPQQDWQRLAHNMPPLPGSLYGPLPGK